VLTRFGSSWWQLGKLPGCLRVSDVAGNETPIVTGGDQTARNR